MNRQEVLEKLCFLQACVSDALDSYAHYAADCFCKKGGFWGTKGYGEQDYRNDGKSIEFIETAVEFALDHCHAAGELCRFLKRINEGW